ncbi:MAG TPA: aldo/keto reductase [Pseudolysinimonas sp.]|nr:aldo/keto reductase [Pseudolysinimonas sp.]
MDVNLPIPTRRLGPGGPEVPLLALGSWNTWDRMEPAEAAALVRRAVEAGAAFFDVAFYNMGPHAENSRTDILFGDAIAAAGVRREQFTVCGKVWLWDPASRFRPQLEVSLQRARLDRFDTVVVGDYAEEPDVPALVREVSALVDDGLTGGWGINNWRIEHTLQAIEVARAEGLTPPTFAQLKYSLVRRSMAEGPHYGALFADGTLALQASDVLEGGILAGKLQPARKIGADMGGIRERIVALWPEVQRIAAGFSVTPTQLAIAFTLTHPATANVLLGVSRVAQLDENLAAVALAAAHGEAIRDAVAGLWLDTAVRADGAW